MDGPMREPAAVLLQRRIDSHKREMEKLLALKKAVDDAGPGSPMEEIVWQLVIKDYPVG